MGHQGTGITSSQDAAWIAFRVLAVCCGGTCPVDATEVVSALGFDDSIAVGRSSETRAEADVEGNGNGERLWRNFQEAGINDCCVLRIA